MGGLLILGVTLEATLAWLLANPAWLPMSGFPTDGLRRVYMVEDEVPIQADPRCAAWDPEVTYLLRPGAFSYVRREFETRYEVNSAGLRDDEASLEGPDLIVLGDSYSMGWGVEQDETYPQVLETSTGLKVLNAAVSSFGTARETILLRRLDASRARAVVVQYFLNDFRENLAFVDAGGHLEITPQDAFDSRVQGARRLASYRPFDYLCRFLDRTPYFPELEQVTLQQVGAACMRTLALSEELASLPIFFLEVGCFGEQPEGVVNGLAEVLQADEFIHLRSRVTVIRLGGILQPSDWFVLDPHLRRSGHAKIAAILEQALEDAELL